jgi:hypothetical protein
MLHLINSVFVTIDEAVDINADRIVISGKYGNGIDAALDNTSAGTLFAYAENYQGLVGAGKTYNSLLELLNFANNKSQETGNEFIIYCDKRALVNIATNFYKALLPLATSSDIFKIINSYQSKSRLDLFSWNVHYNIRDLDNALATLSITSDEVDQAFASSTVRASDFTNFIRNNLSGVSLELLLATYSRNGKLKEELSGVFKSFVSHSIALIASDFKDNFINSVFDKKFQELFNLPDITIDNLDSVLTNPSNPVSVFFDKNIWQPPKAGKVFNINYVLNTIPTDKLKTMGALSKTWISQYSGNNESTLLEWKIWDYVDILSKDDWTPVINDALNDDFLDNPVINKTVNSINVYLYYHILNCHKTNKNGLTPFTINGCV